jgi:thiazole synthase
MSDDLVIAGKHFKSRLILGTGRYRTMEDMVAAVEASGTEMITVAIRRLDLDDPTKKTILDYIDWNKYQILPKKQLVSWLRKVLWCCPTSTPTRPWP